MYFIFQWEKDNKQGELLQYVIFETLKVLKKENKAGQEKKKIHIYIYNGVDVTKMAA